MQKLGNSNSLHSPMHMSQLKGWQETGCPGQHGDALEEVNQELNSSWISFVTEVPCKEGWKNPGTARASSKQSPTAPPKTVLPSCWGQQAEAISKGSALPKGLPLQSKCSFPRRIPWEKLYRKTTRWVSTNFQFSLTGYETHLEATEF